MKTLEEMRELMRRGSPHEREFAKMRLNGDLPLYASEEMRFYDASLIAAVTEAGRLEVRRLQSLIEDET